MGVGLSLLPCPAGPAYRSIVATLKICIRDTFFSTLIAQAPTQISLGASYVDITCSRSKGVASMHQTMGNYIAVGHETQLL